MNNIEQAFLDGFIKAANLSSMSNLSTNLVNKVKQPVVPIVGRIATNIKAPFGYDLGTDGGINAAVHHPIEAIKHIMNDSGPLDTGPWRTDVGQGRDTLTRAGLGLKARNNSLNSISPNLWEPNTNSLAGRNIMNDERMYMTDAMHGLKEIGIKDPSYFQYDSNFGGMPVTRQTNNLGQIYYEGMKNWNYNSANNPSSVKLNYNSANNLMSVSTNRAAGMNYGSIPWTARLSAKVVNALNTPQQMRIDVPYKDITNSPDY